MQKTLKFVIIVIFSASLIFFGLVFYIVKNKDTFIPIFIQKLNENIDTPIQIKNVDIEFFESFPNISFILLEIKIQLEKEKIITLKKVSFQCNLYSVLQKQYDIKNIIIKSGSIFINNYAKHPPPKKTFSPKKNTPPLSLGTIFFQNIQIHYKDLEKNIYISWNIRKGKTTFLQMKQDTISLSLSFTGKIKKNTLGENHIWENEGIELSAKQILIIQNTIASIQKLAIETDYSSIQADIIHDTKKTQIDFLSHIPSLKNFIKNIPTNTQNLLKDYKIESEIFLKGSFVSQENKKEIQSTVTFTKIYTSAPDSLWKIHDGYIKSNFFTDFTLPKTHLLSEKITGKLNNSPFTGKIEIHNFENFNTSLEIEGQMKHATQINEFFPLKNMKCTKGNIRYSVCLSKNLVDGNFYPNGEIEFKDIDISLTDPHISVSNGRGVIIFNKKNIAFNELQGNIGKTDINLTGIVRNPFEKKRETILYFSSDYMDIETLLSLKSNDSPKDTSNYTLNRTQKILLSGKIQHIAYHNFHAKNIKIQGNIEHPNSHIYIETTNSMGGSIILKNSIHFNTQPPISYTLEGSMKNIYLDSLFYSCDNFHQNFIQNTHIKGQIDSEFQLSLPMENNWKIETDSLIAFIKIIGKNGELIDFKPMQKLSLFVKEEKLAHITFAKLENQIFIKHKIITIPQMKISSNIKDIFINGTHSFDQKIDYHLQIPILQNKKKDPDAVFGKIEDPEKKSNYLFLKITGSTDNYIINFDSQAIAEKILSDAKEEKKELLDNIHKQKKKKSILLQENEYIDFNNKKE